MSITTSTGQQVTTQAALQVFEAFNNRRDDWQGWQWTHSFGGRAPEGECDYCETLPSWGSQIVIEPGDEDLDETPNGTCEHYNQALDQARKYRDACKEAAVSARHYACDASEKADEGEWESAVALANQAASLENYYGDSPTWGPFAKLVEELAEHVQLFPVVVL
jgi:hypothetical protein